MLFIDLRDHYGLTQCVVDPDSPAFTLAEKLRSEWVVRIDGKVRARARDGTEQDDMATGRIELYVSEIEVLGAGRRNCRCRFSASRTIPRRRGCNYRFLDLRREQLHQNIMLRGASHHSIRRA